MNPSRLQLLYLKFLYSGIDNAEGETEEAAFLLQNMNLDRLTIERAARLRNLRTVLYSEMKVLNRVLSSKDLLPYVESYAASPSFWEHLGRTQVEDLCLYMVAHLDVEPVIRVACEIEGAYSGLSSGPTKSTPWTLHHVAVSAEQFMESFAVPFSIGWTDDKGNDSFIVKDSDRHCTCTIKVVKERVIIHIK